MGLDRVGLLGLKAQLQSEPCPARWPDEQGETGARLGPQPGHFVDRQRRPGAPYVCTFCRQSWPT